MAHKDFKSWTERKIHLHEEKIRPFFHEGEVWFCALGANIGFEQDGRGKNFLRPVVVIKKFNKEVCWGVPLTKNPRKGLYYFSFELKKRQSTAILSQIRLIDSKRLDYRIGYLKDADFSELKKRLRHLIT